MCRNFSKNYKSITVILEGLFYLHGCQQQWKKNLNFCYGNHVQIMKKQNAGGEKLNKRSNNCALCDWVKGQTTWLNICMYMFSDSFINFSISVYPSSPWYPHTNSWDWSPYITWENVWKKVKVLSLWWSIYYFSYTFLLMM